jgi:hypothetical protein
MGRFRRSSHGSNRVAKEFLDAYLQLKTIDTSLTRPS